MSCKFSDSFEITGGNVAYSPSSSMVASVLGSRLTVRELPSLEVKHIYLCIDKVEKLEFSPDSKYVMCCVFSRNAVQVFSIQDPEWKCRINEGVAGIISAKWSTDSRHIITESDFGIQLTVWSLCDV